MIWNDYTPGVLFLYTLDLVATTLSFFGSLIMIYLCLQVPAPRPVPLKLILSIAFSDFLYAIANIMSALEGHNLNAFCYTEAFVRESSLNMSVFFATCTAIFCYQCSFNIEKFQQTLFFRKACLIGAIICTCLGLL